MIITKLPVENKTNISKVFNKSSGYPFSSVRLGPFFHSSIRSVSTFLFKKSVKSRRFSGENREMALRIREKIGGWLSGFCRIFSKNFFLV
jgi:hypothetical protein